MTSWALWCILRGEPRRNSGAPLNRQFAVRPISFQSRASVAYTRWIAAPRVEQDRVPHMILIFLSKTCDEELQRKARL